MRQGRFVSFGRAGLGVGFSLWWVVAVACGNDPGSGAGGASGSGGGSAGSGLGGSAGSAGSTGKSGSAGSSGTTNGGSTDGGTAGSGGKAGSGGNAGSGGSAGASGGTGGGVNVEPGEPCTANCPTGKVDTCFDNCPFGACDDGLFFAGELCSTYYPEPIDADTIFCAKGQTASYCLTTIDVNQWFYVVNCANGTPTVTKCDGGCGVQESGDHPASCNDM